MKARIQMRVDQRRLQQLVEDILWRKRGHFEWWQPGERGADMALIQIVARYLEILIQRLNQAPEKNQLAFWDLLGIGRIPAQPVRVPVVLQMSADAFDGRIPAGTRLVAPPPPESTRQVVFETERTAGLAAARIEQMVSLWPGRDQFLDHTEDFKNGGPVQLFKRNQLQPTPHTLYIAHETLLALAGKVTLDVEFELVQPGSEPLDILWEYWDGKVWRGFKAMHPSCVEEGEQKLDGTDGLRRSGRFRLETDCAETKKTMVNGIKAFWIRGRLNEPLPPNSAQILPEVERVRLSNVIERPFHVERNRDGSLHEVKTGLLPDKAFADGTELDLTEPFFPYGNQPQPGNAFYISSEEIFSKPGAQVEIAVIRAETPQDTIDRPGSPCAIRLNANPQSLNVSDSPSDITATVLDFKGMGVTDGTLVKLTTTLGTFTNGESTIELQTTNGEVQTKLSSDNAGTAFITARAGFAESTTCVEFTQLI